MSPLVLTSFHSETMLSPLRESSKEEKQGVTARYSSSGSLPSLVQHQTEFADLHPQPLPRGRSSDYNRPFEVLFEVSFRALTSGSIPCQPDVKRFQDMATPAHPPAHIRTMRGSWLWLRLRWGW